MSDPATRAEYDRLFIANTKVSGYGIEGVTQHLPCPFCATSGWASWRIIDLALQDNEPMKRTRTCQSCGRSARIDVTNLPSGGTTAELVQVAGADPPEYLRPWPRRVPDDPLDEALARGEV